MHAPARSLQRDAGFFVALLATSLALAAALAHALELPNKIGMSRDQYFAVQRAHDGWNQLGYLLGVEFIRIVAVAAIYGSEPKVLTPVLVALGCLVAAQVIFWIWTFPANEATGNWIVQTRDWASWRRQWEFSLLAGAAFQTLAMAALIVAVLRRS